MREAYETASSAVDIVCEFLFCFLSGVSDDRTGWNFAKREEKKNGRRFDAKNSQMCVEERKSPRLGLAG